MIDAAIAAAVPAIEDAASEAITVSEGITLELPATPALPRCVRLKYDGKHLTAALYRKSTPRRIGRTFAVAAATIAECALTGDRFPNLWIGSVLLDLTAKEAQQVRAAFAPIGLREWKWRHAP